MNVDIQVNEGRMIARLEGRFDAHAAPTFAKLVTERIGPDLCSLVVDAADVDFLDSSALATLVQTLKRCMEHGGGIQLASVSEPVRVILELTRLDLVFPLVSSVPSTP